MLPYVVCVGTLHACASSPPVPKGLDPHPQSSTLPRQHDRVVTVVRPVARPRLCPC